MKKLLIVVLLATVAIFLSANLLIPKQINITVSETINTSAGTVARSINETQNRNRWWQSSTSIDFAKENLWHAPASSQAYFFSPQKKSITGNGELRLVDQDGRITLALFTWRSPETSGLFQRVKQYFQMDGIKEDLSRQALALKRFAEDGEKVYGLLIREEKVKDSILVSTRKSFTAPPTTEEAYALIAQLQALVKNAGASATNQPMLHVEQIGKTTFELMTAIPIDREIRIAPPFAVKRMVLGRILQAEVKGGPATVNTANRNLANFVRDNKLVSPAIPFELLVTNRTLEKDTAKWVTRIYYPIF